MGVSSWNAGELVNRDQLVDVAGTERSASRNRSLLVGIPAVGSH
jgi:hypothetical protein